MKPQKRELMPLSRRMAYVVKHWRRIAGYLLMLGITFAAVHVSVAASNGSGATLVKGNLEPNGFARYDEVGKPIYIGGLFLGVLSGDPEVIRGVRTKRMEFKLLTNISGRRFGRILTKGAAINNNPRLLVEYARAMEVFLSAFKDDLHHGDHLVMVPNSLGGTSVVLNSVKIAEIAEPEFFDLLLNMWIGSVPPTREFKLKILGLENRLELLQDFEFLQPLPSRRAAVEKWFSQENMPRTFLSDSFMPITNEDLAENTGYGSQSVSDIKNDVKAEDVLSEQFYINRLLLHSQQMMVYPELSRRMRHEGSVLVSVTIDREGKLLNYELVESSKYRLLNDAVAEGIVKAEPFPPMPEKVLGDTYTFTVPVEFKNRS